MNLIEKSLEIALQAYSSKTYKTGRPEINACNMLLEEMKRDIQENGNSVTGFNIGMNIGEDSGQTIFHAHIHLIPRRKDDMDNPRGGVRGVIPKKQAYW